MIHRPWPYLPRLIATMADSSIPPAPLVHGERSDGVHLSQLLRKLHPIDSKRMAEEDNLAVMGMLGLAFEDRAERALHFLSKQEDWPWFSFRPGEVVSDEGNKCSPDILMVPKPTFAHFPLRELSLKCTWKSSNGFPTEEGENGFDPKFGYYLDQCLGYGTPLDTEGAIIVAYFVRSSYKTSVPSPLILGAELDWTLQERQETWDQLMAIAAEGA
jgi:hypothetical protein